jgi:uncharacterized protein YdeI (YjbR/CyaY-like superfamily)
LSQTEAMFFANADEFESWLETNAESRDSIWIKIAKKSSGVRSLDVESAVEVALCFGWIDSKGKRLDDTWFLLRLTPRRPKSNWSKVNRRRAEALIAAGRMRPAGMSEIERAKEDGRWAAASEPD